MTKSQINKKANDLASQILPLPAHKIFTESDLDCKVAFLCMTAEIAGETEVAKACNELMIAI